MLVIGLAWTASMAANTPEERLGVAQAMVDAWNGQDWETVYGLFAEDAVLRSMMLEPIVGRAAIRERLSKLAPGVEEIELQLRNFGTIGEVVVLERVDDFTYLGKHSRVPVVGVMEIDNGQVQEWREYYDHASLARALTPDGQANDMSRVPVHEASHEGPGYSSGAEAEIRRLTFRLQNDWNSGDMEGYLAAYWKDPGVSMMFGDTGLRGWQAIADLFRATWATEHAMGDFSTRDVAVKVLDDETAISSGAFRHVFPAETVEGAFTQVWRRYGDRWLIVHEHTSRKH